VKNNRKECQANQEVKEIKRI
jgi:hypothetical protein